MMPPAQHGSRAGGLFGIHQEPRLGTGVTRIRQRGVCARQERKEAKRRLRAWGVVRRAGVWSRVHEGLWEPSIEPLAYLGGPRRSSGGKGHGPLVYPKVPVPRSPGLTRTKANDLVSIKVSYVVWYRCNGSCIWYKSQSIVPRNEQPSNLRTAHDWPPKRCAATPLQR